MRNNVIGVMKRKLQLLAAMIATTIGVGGEMATASPMAGDVQFSLTQRETWVGSPAVMTITVRDADNIGEPICPTVEGLAFEVQPGRQTMNSMQIINGQVTKENTTTITVLITPLRVGTFALGPISLTVDGRIFTSKPSSISSKASITGDLMKVVVTGAPDQIWIGESMQVTLQIMVKPFKSPEHRVTLSETDMWQFIDAERSEFGIFAKPLGEMSQRGQRPLGHEELIDGTAYIVYEIPSQYTPAAAGKPDFSQVHIAWKYPTRITESRGFFGRPELTVSATKPIMERAVTEGIDVRELPTLNRPDSFSGAVGDFSITASAKPLRVSVGDPITLTLTITDRLSGHALEQLQAPLLNSPAMNESFRMPSAPLAGTISGNQKSFTQTLRPVRAGTDEIPPIAFSWFDPASASYKSASTQPIPIDVVASEKLSTDAVLGPQLPTHGGPKTLTEADGGLIANIAPTPAIVRNQSIALAPVATTLIVLCPPLACAAALMMRRRKDRMDSNPDLARRRGARNAALALIAKGQCAQAIAGYIASQIDQPSGSVTSAEAVNLLAMVDASPEVTRGVKESLGHAERSRFSARPQSAPLAADMDQARACIASLEKLDWSRVRGLRTGDIK